MATWTQHFWDTTWLVGLLVLTFLTRSGPACVYVGALGAVHLLAGAPRWQIAPTYVNLLLCATGFTYRGLDNWAYGHVTPWVVGGSLLLCGFAHALMPANPRFPPTTGPFSAALHVVRIQSRTRSVDFMLRLYYPTLPAPRTSPSRLPYLYAGAPVAEGYARYVGLPSFLMSWLRYLPGFAFDADPKTCPPAAPGGSRLPVCVFSHGMGGTPDCYAGVVSELVSHGWLVAMPEHADGSAAYVSFPDGFSAYYSPLTPRERAHTHLAYQRRHKQVTQRAVELQAAIDFLVQLGQEPPTGGDAPREADDVWFMRMLLAAAPSKLTLDTTNLAAVGHSFGAATCLLAAETDKRITSVVALDPWLFPLSHTSIRRGLPHVPVLSVCADGWTVWAENARAVELMLSRHHRAAFSAGDSAAFAASLERDAGRVRQRAQVKARKTAATAAESDEEDAATATVGIPGNGVSPAGDVHPDMLCDVLTHDRHTLVTLHGAEHISFSDFGVLLKWPARLVKRIGREDPGDVIVAVRALSIAFITRVHARTDGAAPPQGKHHVALRASNSDWTLHVPVHPRLLSQTAWLPESR